VNHEQIANGFSLALQEISKDLNFVRRGTHLVSTPEIKHHVLALYSEVFEFLCYAIKWYSSKWNRFLKAFDGNFYDKQVQQRVSRIQKLVQRVRDEIKISTNETVQTIHREQRHGFNEANERIEKMDMKLEIMGRDFKELAELMTRTLMANAQHGRSLPPTGDECASNTFTELLDLRSRQNVIEFAVREVASLTGKCSIYPTSTQQLTSRRRDIIDPKNETREIFPAD
jgi:hypothetical protein